MGHHLLFDFEGFSFFLRSVGGGTVRVYRSLYFVADWPPPAHLPSTNQPTVWGLSISSQPTVHLIGALLLLPVRSATAQGFIFDPSTQASLMSSPGMEEALTVWRGLMQYNSPEQAQVKVGAGMLLHGGSASCL